MIKGLTNRGAAFAQIGNIRKGVKVIKDGVERPVDLKYFRVEFDEQEKERAEKFKKVYGEQPTEINILLPFDDIDRCWDAWCEAYTAGRMVARSDGEHFLYLVDLETGEQVVVDGVDKHGQRVPHRELIGKVGKSEIRCKPVGRLKVIVPELQSVVYLVVHTTSWHDIKNISEQLEGIRLLNGGHIAGIPLVLRRRPKKISVPKPDGQRVRMEKWMLSIEADPRWVQAKMAQLQAAALPATLLPDHAPEEEASVEEVLYDDAEWGVDIEDEPGEPDILPEAIQRTPAIRYNPEELKRQIAEVSNKMLGKTASHEQRGLVVHCLEAALSFTTDPEAMRKFLTKKLTGYAGVKDMPDHYVLALYRWLNPSKDSGGDWQAEEMAQREAAAALAYFMPAQESLLNET